MIENSQFSPIRNSPSPHSPLNRNHIILQKLSKNSKKFLSEELATNSAAPVEATQDRQQRVHTNLSLFLFVNNYL